jgi:hypothetical protein
MNRRHMPVSNPLSIGLQIGLREGYVHFTTGSRAASAKVRAVAAVRVDQGTKDTSSSCWTNTNCEVLSSMLLDGGRLPQSAR